MCGLYFYYYICHVSCVARVCAFIIYFVKQITFVVHVINSFLLCACCGLGLHEFVLTLYYYYHMFMQSVETSFFFTLCAHTRHCVVINHQKKAIKRI